MLDRVLLFPYSLILKCRANRYRKCECRSEVPSICVGNVTVGGTGKTPHTEMILELLQQSAEWGDRNLAVLSRGYKRKSKGFQQVITDGSARKSGDEPLQIKRKFQDVTVAVNADRIEGCDLLCHPEKLHEGRKYRKCSYKDFNAAELIVLDDAFQYIKLKADVSIVLIDYNRPVDRDRLLPLGRLRDLPERIADADIIIITKCPYSLEEDEMDAWARRFGREDRSSVFFTTIQYDAMKPIFGVADTRYIYSKKAIMFSGIADDTPFMKYLCGQYKILGRYNFPDHHRYVRSDFGRIRELSKREPTAVIITTEKDAQRVLDVNGLSREMQMKLFYCPVRVRFIGENEKERFAALLLSMLKRNRS